jgi:hypothetical protein
MSHDARIWRVDVGTRCQRKCDGAAGVIVNRTQAATSRPLPGVYGKTLLSVRLDDETLRAAGDMTGDLSWFTSNFTYQR